MSARQEKVREALTCPDHDRPSRSCLTCENNAAALAEVEECETRLEKTHRYLQEQTTRADGYQRRAVAAEEAQRLVVDRWERGKEALRARAEAAEAALVNWEKAYEAVNRQRVAAEAEAETHREGWKAWSAANYRADAALKRAFAAEAEADRLKAALTGTQNVLDSVQWSGYAQIGIAPCPICGEEQKDGHDPDCPIPEALAPADRNTT